MFYTPIRYETSNLLKPLQEYIYIYIYISVSYPFIKLYRFFARCAEKRCQQWQRRDALQCVFTNSTTAKINYELTITNYEIKY